MPLVLYTSLAANAVAIIAIIYLFARLAEETVNAEAVPGLMAELAAERMKNAALREVNGELLTEVTGYRAKAEQVRAGALRASLASAAKRKNGGARVNAH